MRGGIYVILNEVNGHFYLGRAAHFVNRKSSHLQALRRGDHANPRLQRAYRRYGEAAFSFELLYLLPLSEQRAVEERLLRQIVGLRECYNMAPHSEGGCRRHTATSRAKISVALRGRAQSPEWVAKRAASRRGRPVVRRPEAEERRKAAARQYWQGRHHGDVTIAKMRLAMRGRPVSDATIAGREAYIVSVRTHGLRPETRERRASALKSQCIHGHAFTSENTARRKTGGRRCRACARTRARNVRSARRDTDRTPET